MDLFDLFEEYKKLWKILEKSFREDLKITEREIVKELKHWRSNKTNVKFDPDIIPYIEVSEYYNKRNTILFVGMNPSGADIPFYTEENKNHSHVLIYNGRSPYYQTMQKFANECYEKDSTFAELDVFGIVQAKQKVIEDDFQKNPQYYKKMFELFLKGMKELDPEVIVVANAFVRKIMLREEPFNNNKYNDFYGEYIPPTKNKDFGGYDIEIGSSEDPNRRKFKIYFSCMLSGGHLDLGNRDNLIWLIQNYLKNRSKKL